MIGKILFDSAKEYLDQCTDREVRLHFLAARRWFGWRESEPDYDERTRQGQIDAIICADPVVVEGGAFDFWASRGIIKKRQLTRWRNEAGFN